jgi:hypothetical protein
VTERFQIIVAPEVNPFYDRHEIGEGVIAAQGGVSVEDELPFFGIKRGEAGVVQYSLHRFECLGSLLGEQRADNGRADGRVGVSDEQAENVDGDWIWAIA